MAYTLVPTELIVDGAITSAKLDTNIAISGTLGVTGEVTLATHLVMGDNDKIKIGTGGDLEIYHDGSNSYISNSTGNIYLGDTNGSVHIQAKLNEESIVCASDGAVTLYHDNSPKLATSSAGVTVTGTLAATLSTAAQPNITSVGTLIGFTSTGIDDNATSTSITIDSSENVGIGNTQATAINNASGLGNLVVGSGSGAEGITIYSGSDSYGGLNFADATSGGGSYAGYIKFNHVDNSFGHFIGNTEKMRIDSSGNVGINTSSPTSYANSQATLVIQDTGSPAIAWSDTGQSKDWFAVAQGSGLYFNYADGGGSGGASNVTDVLVLDNSGNVGIGGSPNAPLTVSSSSTKTVKVQNTTSSGTSIFVQNSTTGTGDTDGTYFGLDGSENAYLWNYESTNMVFGTSSTERMRIDSSGNVGIGAAPNFTLGVHKAAANSNYIQITNSDTGNAAGDGFLVGVASNEAATIWNQENTSMNFGTNGTERMRIDSSGNVTIGKTSTGTIATVGIDLRASGLAEFTATDSQAIAINRLNTDGVLVYFLQDTSFEGTIAVSGATVSYNGFSGNHETSGISTDTEIGTVCSTIDELDTYVSGTKSGQTRGDHAKIKISDTVGDTRVYGVLSSYSEKDNKPTVASVGIGSVKVTGACSGGDLLESNGDGTAKVQSDDIVRSKTIGKVTIGNSSAGVKLVSCVLYCG